MLPIRAASRSLSLALRSRTFCSRVAYAGRVMGQKGVMPVLSHPGRRYYASEVDPAAADFMQSVSRTAVFRKLSNCPEALLALKKLADTMQTAGFDLSKPPSAVQMLKMAANSDLRDAAKQFREELQKAGVEFTQEELAELMSLRPAPKE